MDESDTPRWLLRPMGARGLPSEIRIENEPKTLGRDPSNNVPLDPDEFPHVSSHHSRVFLRDDRPIVEDLGSKNGTLVNGDEVRRQVLRNGDILQLGELGPRLAVVRSTGLNETLPIMPSRLRPKKPEFGDSTVSNLRELIGAAKPEDVSQAVRAGERRTVKIAIAAVTMVLVIACVAVYVAYDQGQREAEALRDLTARLTSQVERANDRLEEQGADMQAQRARLEAEREKLAAEVEAVKAGERTASDSLEELRKQLASTTQKLEMFDPVNLERERLADVSRVQSAVVLIEAKIGLRDRESLNRLYLTRDSNGNPLPNLMGEGRPYTRESTGSGFCVSKRGYILTNAHVALPEGPSRVIKGPGGLSFDTVVDLSVVFTGDSRRHRAELVTTTAAGKEDMALIRITPFEGMPVIDNFSIDTPPPSPGTEVFLFGFPLGKLVLQEGDTVVASTFKGILSRRVGDFLQIDASVHPGNSGGPVTDSSGRVIGIVSRVQATPDGEIAHAIGYVIPVQRASSVWPPPGE